MTVVDDLYDLDWQETPDLRVTLADGQEYTVHITDAVVVTDRTRYGDGELDYSLEFPDFDIKDDTLPSQFGYIYYSQTKNGADDGPKLLVWEYPDSDPENREEAELGAIGSIAPLTTEGTDA